MELSEALERAERNENVRRLKGFFLCSGFTSISMDRQHDVREWTLLYYNPGTKNVIDCFVNEKFVTVGEEMPAVKEMQELELVKIRLPVQEALLVAEARIKKKPLNILVSLHMKHVNEKNYSVWTIGFVTADMSVTSMDIDAANGRILREETTKLMRRV